MRDLFFQASDVTIRAKSGGPPSFTVVAYTGGLLRIAGWDLPVVVDLAGLQPGKSLIANLDHNSRQRVGHVTEYDNDGRRLKLAGLLSAVTPHRNEVLESYREGFRWQASVEVNVEESHDLDRGQRVMVNGRAFTGPLSITTVGILKGFAFVSHGADDETTVSIAAGRDNGFDVSHETYRPAWSHSQVNPGGSITYCPNITKR